MEDEEEVKDEKHDLNPRHNHETTELKANMEVHKVYHSFMIEKIVS